MLVRVPPKILEKIDQQLKIWFSDERKNIRDLTKFDQELAGWLIVEVHHKKTSKKKRAAKPICGQRVPTSRLDRLTRIKGKQS